MSDQAANPQAGAGEADVAFDPIAYLKSEANAEAPQEAQPEKPEGGAEAAREADTAETTGDKPETDAGPDAPAEAEEEPRYRVKVNGEEIEVTLSELQAGYQKDADYRRKTASLSEERKALDAERAEAKRVRDEAEAIRLQALAAADEQEPDWVKLATDDPIGWPEARARWEARKAQQFAAREALKLQHEAKRVEIAAREWQSLVAKVPELADPKKADEMGRSLAAAASEHYGITPDELKVNLDHRLLVMLKDAAAWRELQKAKPAVEKKVSQAPKVLTPGSPATKAEDAATKRRALTETLRRNPSSIEAQVAFLKGA